MSTQDDPKPTQTTVDLGYGGTSELVSGDTEQLTLFAARGRDDVHADGTIKDVVRVREALSALYAIVQSDARYTPKDRTAYQAYRRLKQQTAGMASWQAQQAYFDWLARNDPTAWLLLDPIVTVHPDALIWEVFSKDEGTYGQLTIDWSAFELDGKIRPGTTHIDFSQALYDGIQRIRSHRPTRLTIGREAVKVETGETAVVEKQIKVPDTWLRGFLQVQSAATLSQTKCSIAPLDLYNALRQLRLNKDQKRKGRALRIELVPGESPRLVLEPWELVLKTSGEAYTGRKAQVVRIWGRRRLMLIRRFLPFVESIDLHLLGSGMPNFWVLRAGPISLTLGLSGFSASNWSRALTFDVMLPRPDVPDADFEAVMTDLSTHWSASVADLAKRTKIKPVEVSRRLQAACQSGLVMYDLAHDVYRLRPLLDQPLPAERLQHRNPRERQAHDLLAIKKAVKITQENRIRGEGVELTGKVVVAADKREYRPQMLVADDGRVFRAQCTCAYHRQNKLKHGPCAHLTALCLLYATEEQRKIQQRGKARKTVTIETRTYARRHDDGETVYQLTLNRDRLRIRWGERSSDRLRLQQLFFDAVEDARTAYFERIDDLEANGFLDATG